MNFLTMMHSQIQEHSGGIFNLLLDVFEEGHGISTVDNTVVVGQCNVHHGTDFYLAVNDNGSLENAVHPKDGRLRGVQDRCSEKRTINATVGNCEGTSDHVFHGDLACPCPFAEVANGSLNASKGQRLAVAENRHHQTRRGGHSYADIDVVSVDDRFVLKVKHSIDSRSSDKSIRSSFDKHRHEPEFDPVFLFEILLVLGAQCHDVVHVDFVESGQAGGSILRVFQPLGNGQTHAAERN
mmetsp:Transcript_16129/g.31610  ORF Transcript_16129/g.31610 Transcript_16129/m.31610 type:complete len:239 (+) Transcript_16129:41-757(+)